MPPLVLLEEFLQGWKIDGKQVAQLMTSDLHFNFLQIPPYNILSKFKMASSGLEKDCALGCYCICHPFRLMSLKLF